MKNTQSSAAANHVTDLVNTETGELKAVSPHLGGSEGGLRYLPGYPQVVRFDASRGMFNINGNMPLTKKGEAFTIVPVAFRIFKDNILGFGLKRWAEFFFISAPSQQGESLSRTSVGSWGGANVCNLLVHGFSVENLMRSIQEMYYDGSSLCQVALTLKPVEKTNKETGSKYFIAEFSFKKLDAATLDILQAATTGLKIWREDTLTGDAVIELSANYNPPIQHINGHGVIEEAALVESEA